MGFNACVQVHECVLSQLVTCNKTQIGSTLCVCGIVSASDKAVNLNDYLCYSCPSAFSFGLEDFCSDSKPQFRFMLVSDVSV